MILTVDIYEKALGEVKFPNHEKFANVSDAYSNLVQNLMKVIDKVNPPYITNLSNNI